MITEDCGGLGVASQIRTACPGRARSASAGHRVDGPAV